MQQQFITNSFEETQQIGENFAHLLEGGEIVALYGDLGSGKTTFVQGLAKGLGITRNINSPTFIIAREYSIKNQESSIKEFVHIDLYRIESKKEVMNLGLSDLFNNSESVVAIEWAEKVRDLLPQKRIEVHFTYLEDDKRKIIIKTEEDL